MIKDERDKTRVDSGSLLNGWEIQAEAWAYRVNYSRLPSVFPKAPAFGLARLCLNGDVEAYRNLLSSELIFFDLETTGLSCGAGTVAFLAAFGRICMINGQPYLEARQYMLLDYPGEQLFLAAIKRELESKGQAPVLVSYNGRSFDCQLLNSRFIMNGFPPVFYRHLDLLYPARRLFKKKLINCAQATIEKSVLRLDRGDDLSGAEAPEAWFSYLRTGQSERLEAAAEHNRRDIEGLALLFAKLDDIARDPVSALNEDLVDNEALALRYHRYRAETPYTNDTDWSGESEKLRILLLSEAARKGSFTANAILAREAELNGNLSRAYELWLKIVEVLEIEMMKLISNKALSNGTNRLLAAYRALSRISEKNNAIEEALHWLDKQASLVDGSDRMKARIEKRRDRLTKKAYLLDRRRS